MSTEIIISKKVFVYGRENHYLCGYILIQMRAYVDSTTLVLLFYYNMVENKYFLLDGYPNVYVLSNPQKTQELRNENMQKISSEWAKFINQLKKEGRYRN